jgi:hypothetical protein
VFKCERKRGGDFKSSRVCLAATTTRSAGRVVNNQENLAVMEPTAMPVLPILDQQIPELKGFTIEDILWAVGIWSVLLTMSPVILFYVLMVA